MALDLARGRTALKAGIIPDAAFKEAAQQADRGNLDGAEKIFRALLEQHPNHFGTLRALAGVLLRAGRPTEAVSVLRKALNQRPNAAEAHAALGGALRTLERYDEALERAGRAIALNPGYAEGHFVLAQCLMELGRHDEAVRAQARAIELAPDLPHHYYQYGDITRWTADDPRIAKLEALADRPGSMPLEEQVYANFALAKAYGDVGDIERSFRYQMKGGALKRRTLRYDEADTLGQLDELCRTVDGAWLGRHRGSGDPSAAPVFILGMPRSGTTLVEQILASHPKIRALGERPTFERALVQICGTQDVFPALPRLAAQWSAAELRKLGALYLDSAPRDAPAAVRITDKETSNFRFAGLISAALPNARIIHTRRDPIDTCLSIFSILFTRDGQPYSYELGELGRYYRAYEKMMTHWRSVLPPGIMLDVHYEDVVDDVEQQARRIVAHCGLDWDDACLAFHKTDRAIRTASHAQVRQPIYRSSVGRPRPSKDLLQPLLAALGLQELSPAGTTQNT